MKRRYWHFFVHPCVGAIALGDVPEVGWGVCRRHAVAVGVLVHDNGPVITMGVGIYLLSGCSPDPFGVWLLLLTGRLGAEAFGCHGVDWGWKWR